MTVATLLQQSRSAHLAGKLAAGRTDANGVVVSALDTVKAKASIYESLSLREDAHALDPDMSDPAWSADLGANKGVKSADLMAWFRQYLGV